MPFPLVQLVLCLANAQLARTGADLAVSFELVFQSNLFHFVCLIFILFSLPLAGVVSFCRFMRSSILPWMSLLRHPVLLCVCHGSGPQAREAGRVLEEGREEWPPLAIW